MVNSDNNSKRSLRREKSSASVHKRRPSRADRKALKGGSASAYSRSAYTNSSDSPRVEAPDTLISVAALQNKEALRQSGRYSRNAETREYIRVQKERRKKAKRKRIALISLLVAAVLLLGGALAAFAYLAHLENSMQDRVDEDLLNSLVVTDSPEDPFYMLLIGADKSESRESSGKYGVYRTDTIILTRVDPKEKTVTMISIPRDTRVYLEGHGYQKINAAYAYGGPSLAVKTVSELAGVDINHYAEVDFDGFKAVVDALGGITVNVPVEIDDHHVGTYVAAGEQTLNGSEALAVARSRHAYDNYGNGDQMRAANQRMILMAVMDKVMTSDVATLTNTVSTLAQYITTDYSISGIIGLAQSMIGINVSEDVYTASAPTNSSYENNLWWEILDETAWKAMMERVDQGLPPTEEAIVDEATGTVLTTTGSKEGQDESSSSSSENVSLSGVEIAVKNGAGIAGCAGQAADKLTPLGADVETGNADDFNYEKTLVIYNDSSDKAKAEAIADALGVGKVTKNDGRYAFSADFLVVVGGDWA